MVTQMAEQLVTEGHIDEWELQNMNLHQTRREIGLSLLSHSGKFGFVYMYLIQNTFGVKKARPNKVESYLEVNT